MNRFSHSLSLGIACALSWIGTSASLLAQVASDLPPMGGVVTASPNGEWLFSTRLLDRAEGKIRNAYDRSTTLLRSGTDFAPSVILDLDATDDLLTTIGSNGRATIYELESFSRLRNFAVEQQGNGIPKLGRIRISPTGEWIIAAANGHPQLFRPTSQTPQGRFIQTVPGFEVSVAHGTSFINGEERARALLDGTQTEGGRFVENRQSVNFARELRGERYPNVQAYPGSAQNETRDWTTFRARGTVLIPEAGFWSFAVHSLMGAWLTVGDDRQVKNGRIEPHTTVFQYNFPEPGRYPIELFLIQNRDISVVELSARQGFHREWSEEFRLVGDRDNGGLAVESTFATTNDTAPPLPFHPGFAVTMARIPDGYEDHRVALAKLEDPSLHSWRVTGTRPKTNFRRNRPTTLEESYPGFDLRGASLVRNSAMKIESELYFPTAGDWSFRVTRSSTHYVLDVEGAGRVEADFNDFRRDPIVLRIPEAGWRRLRFEMSARPDSVISDLELAAQPGNQPDFENEGFRILGDTANGGLESRIPPTAFEREDLSPDFHLTDLAFSPDGSRVAVARNILPAGANASVFDLEGNRLASVDAIDIRALALSPDNQRLAISGRHPTEGDYLTIYELGESGPVPVFERAEGAHQIRYSPDGSKLLLTGGVTSSARILDAQTGEPVEFIGTTFTRAAEFIGDGSEILIGGPNNRQPIQIIHTERALAANGFEVWGDNYSLENLTPQDAFSLLRPLDGTFFDLGFSIHGAGDVNGDGWEDFVVGADFANAPDGNGNTLINAGIAFLIFGGPAAFEAETLLTSEIDGLNGVIFPGLAENALIGLVAAAGDVNGDGFDDILIGAQHGVSRYINPEAPNAERISRPDVTLIYGRPSTDPNAFGPNGFYDLANPMAGTADRPDDIRLVGSSKRGDFHQSRMMASAGDFNNDGFDDLIIGMPATFEGAGAAYLVLGSPLGPRFGQLEDYDGTNGGTEIMHGTEGDHLGRFSTGIGDFNGDGYDDVVILASRAGQNGEAYLVYGRPTDQLPTTPLTPDDLADRTQGGVIFASDDAINIVSDANAVGDFNGDGLNDLALGTSFAVGQAMVIYGTRSSLGDNGRLDLARLTPDQGLVLVGNEQGANWGIGAPGDTNGDGFADLLFADFSNRDGSVRLVYGAPTTHWRERNGRLVYADRLPGDLTHITGEEGGFEAGFDLSSAGDFNRDGFPDLLVSARAGYVRVIYSPASATEATFSTHTAAVPAGTVAGTPPVLKLVGRTGNNTASRPFSQVALGIGDLRTQFDLPSTQTVTINRTPAPLPAGGGNFTRAAVHWNISTPQQTQFAESQLVFYYTNAQVGALNLEEADVWYTTDSEPTEESLWSPLSATLDPVDQTFTVNRTHQPENAPNQLTGTYTIMQVSLSYQLASEIPPPPSVDLDRLPPTGPVLGNEPANPSDRPVVWDNNQRKLYAVRSGEYRIDWNQINGDTMASTTASFVWPESPDAYQSHVYGTPDVSLGNVDIAQLHDTETNADADRVARDKVFAAGTPGRSLIRLSAAGPDAAPKFILIHSYSWLEVPGFAEEPALIGTAIQPAESIHDPACGGPFVMPRMGRYCAAPGFYDRATRTGPIIPVNLVTDLEQNGLIIAYYQMGAVLDAATQTREPNDICWPYTTRQYNPEWPPSIGTPQVVIASELGAGEIDPATYGGEWNLYFQNDPTQPGFNPNDEHARIANNINGHRTLMPLRSDLGSDTTSEPYVLMTYVNPETSEPSMELFRVVAETETQGFNYQVVAGQPLFPPRPISDDPICLENHAVESPTIFEDRKGGHWARSADPDGISTSPGRMRFWYPVRETYFFPENYPAPQAPQCVPFLDLHRGTPGEPVEVNYTIRWPEDAPVLRVGETLVEATRGLPTIGVLPSADGTPGSGPCSVDIIFQAASANNPDRHSVRLIDPLRAHRVTTGFIPEPDAIEIVRGETRFRGLPPHLAERLSYARISDTEATLQFRGIYRRPAIGTPTLLLNVISVIDEAVLKQLIPEDEEWDIAITRLAELTRENLAFTEANTEPQLLALSAGAATGTGFVTLAFQNREASLCNEDLPVSLEVIRVEGAFRGEVAVIEPSCFFDEKLTLHHQGDFGGQPESFHFEWRLQPDGAEDENTDPTEPASIPQSPSDSTEGWDLVAEGTGEASFIIEGASPFTLSDNWLIVRYRPLENPLFASAENPEGWSDWTPAKLAPGWIKRVLEGLTPFEQRFEDLSDPSRQLNTTVDMLTQAGRRWEGSVPLNCDAADDFGLIEIYETVYNRATALSIDAGIAYQPANNALLLMASRISDLYLLLGNEAFADASDPTIGIVSDSPDAYAAAATSLHAFAGLQATPDLLTEELVLLRGRSDDTLPPVSTSPIYNRLPWNYSGDLGEVAYQLNYDIQDSPGSFDGRLDENDAANAYPQGHGDAWGHYLSSLSYYYRLLHDPLFNWIPRSETASIGGADVTVDFVEEQKFAKAAAAKATAGAEIVNLTYRSRYVENPSGQYQGYQDRNRERAWGLSDWGTRAGQGAYFDWALGNATLPANAAPNGQADNRPIDRSSVRDLGEIATAYRQIQAEVDNADRGLNPLGLEKNVMPFDISASEIDANRTFFEQIYDRAITALSSAVTVFNYALNNTQQLRRQSDDLTEYQNEVEARESDFQSRLIEVFGQPYREDIGGSGTYPLGYKGPDIYHYTYVDRSELLGLVNDGDQLELTTEDFTVEYQQEPFEFQAGSGDLDVSIDEEDGLLSSTSRTIRYHYSPDFGLVKPDDWSTRLSSGEIQSARSDLLQMVGTLRAGLANYQQLIDDIESRAELIEAQHNINRERIQLLDDQAKSVRGLNVAIGISRNLSLLLSTSASDVKESGEAIAEALPKVVGTSTDGTAPARSAIRISGTKAALAMATLSNVAEAAAGDMELAKENTQLRTNLRIAELEGSFALQEAIAELESMIRDQEALKYELLVQAEAMNQAAAQFTAVLTKGERLLDSFTRFRLETAAAIQQQRYKNMAYRIFRNDALQKYRAQFDLASRYAYLAARAYDYETNFLPNDPRGAGEDFLNQIVRSRSLGILIDNDGDGTFNPVTGGRQGDPGLADAMARLNANWTLNLKGQLGFNNPQPDRGVFSLRFDAFNILPDNDLNADPNRSHILWKERLDAFRVSNILAIPEFNRYCIPFSPRDPEEPGIVIPFATTINAGQNFFGNPLAPNQQQFDSTKFSTKIRSVAVLFDSLETAGISSQPLVYLVPLGVDIMRSPSDLANQQTREWRILEQTLPVPFPLQRDPFTGGAPLALTQPDWVPTLNGLNGSLGAIRRFGAFKAVGFRDPLPSTDFTRNSRLVGRSVWNNRWLLIIPGRTLLADQVEGIARFIEGPVTNFQSGERSGRGITDIKIIFEAYSLSAN